MKSFLGIELSESTLGILYLCKYNYVDNTIQVIIEIEFDNGFDALNAYANIPNPESQMAAGKNKESFEKDLKKLHAKLNDPKWVEELAEYL
jgi:hypothetical protein